MKITKNYILLFYIAFVIVTGLITYFYFNDNNKLYPNKEFNKVFVPNTKIYKQIQEYVDKMLYNYSGIDRINVFNFHNGTEDIRQIPFLKESIQIRSLRDERFDITESFKDFPVPHDLYKINYLYENGFLLIDSNSQLVPKSMKSQLQKYNIKNSVYNILISNDGIPFGYVSMDNINSKDFKFTAKDSISFMKDVTELEIMFDRLLREKKETFDNTYTFMFLIGFTGVIILTLVFSLIVLNNITNNKLNEIIEFFKPKFEMVSETFQMFKTDIQTINNKVVALEDDRKIQVDKNKSTMEILINTLEETGDKLDDINTRLIKVENKNKK